MKKLVCDIYHRIYDSKRKIHRFIFNAFTAYLIICVIKYLIEDWTLHQALLYAGRSIISYLIFRAFTYIFHTTIGKYMLLYHKAIQTSDYCYYEMPKHIKIVGFPGAGKDSLSSGISDDDIQNIKNDIKKDLASEATQLYMFDLKLLKKALKENPEALNSPSKKFKTEGFEKLYLRYDGFIAKNFKANYDYMDILEDYKQNKEKLRVCDSKYVITDNITYEHIYQKLLKFAIKYYRLDIVDMYLLANQPFIQSYDPKTKEIKMAGVYSPDFIRTSHEVEEHKHVKYQPKVLFPLEDYCIVLETEVDIWWFNLSKEAKEQLLDYESRSFECLKRHVVGENFRTIRVGQVSSRTQKTQRDLEEGYIRPTRKVVVDGAPFTRFILSISKLFVYLLFLFIPKIRKKLVAKIEVAKKKAANKGYVKFEIVFSRTEAIGYTAEPVTLYRLLNKDEPVYLTSYSVELVFKKSLWSRYNTHYLERKGEDLAQQSDMKLTDIVRWTPDMKLHREQVKEMNYAEMNRMFKIGEEEKYKNTRKYVQIIEEPKKRKEVPAELPTGKPKKQEQEGEKNEL